MKLLIIVMLGALILSSCSKKSEEKKAVLEYTQAACYRYRDSKVVECLEFKDLKSADMKVASNYCDAIGKDAGKTHDSQGKWKPNELCAMKGAIAQCSGNRSLNQPTKVYYKEMQINKAGQKNKLLEVYKTQCKENWVNL